MISIFISHASRDKQTILRIVSELPKHISRWIDQEQICAGDLIPDRIERGITESDLFLLFISPDAVKSDWVKREIALAKARECDTPFNLNFLIPIRMPGVDDSDYALLFDSASDTKYLALKGYDDHDILSLTSQLRMEVERWTAEFVVEYKRLKNVEDSPNRTIAQRAEKLWVRIADYADDDLWTEIEDICVHAVISGGVTAMTYYRQAKKTAVKLDEKPNPSYSADLQATISILRAFDSRAKEHIRALGCELYYLGEETVYHDELLKGISSSLEGDILDRDEFFLRSSNSIRVIIDAIDGTSNFIRGLPFFCSSIAIFVEEQVRVAAIYDPLRHEVYSAALVGPQSDPSRGAKARVWDIGAGSNRDLTINSMDVQGETNGKSLAVHIPRSNQTQRNRFLSTRDSNKTMFEELSREASTIYCLNTGLLALAQVANWALDGFVNIYTNPWDVAAGEVLLRACGCRVTDLAGEPFAYRDGGKIGVVAARSRTFHEDLLQIIEKTDLSLCDDKSDGAQQDTDLL